MSGNVDAFIKAKDDLALEASKGEPNDPVLEISTISNSMDLDAGTQVREIISWG